ncbi:amidohydrolase family protein [Actinomadura sp. 3N508]|uniref:amidohydrolase family protein n=1 Tax=Actinomadura sp. 3N508 TaxID=3375153 RepID=UPI003794661D
MPESAGNAAENAPYLIISSDTHAGLRTDQYRDFLESRYHPQLDRYLERMRASTGMREKLYDQEFVSEWRAEHDEGLAGGWDAARRDQELDRDGVTGEVIFPDADGESGATAVPFSAGLGMSGSGYDPSLALAGARAHNRWLAGLCAQSPARRRGVIVAPIVGNVEAAAAEIRRAHADGLRGGVMIPSLWGHGNRPYHDREYDAIWAVCEELGLPVQTHASAAPSEDLGLYLGLYATEVSWWSARPMWFLIWSGVFERFPGLRFGVQECGLWWVASLLWQMDVAFEREHGTRKLADLGTHMKRRPSEYFDTNCFVGASTAKRRELADRHQIGVGNILWGNDFPHSEGSWPHTREWIAYTFADIPEDETRVMLGEAAVEMFHFDRAELIPIARRIGPRPSDLGRDTSNATPTPPEPLDRHWLTGPDVPDISRSA